MSYRRKEPRIKMNKFTVYILQKFGIDKLIDLYLALVKFLRKEE